MPAVWTFIILQGKLTVETKVTRAQVPEGPGRKRDFLAPLCSLFGNDNKGTQTMWSILSLRGPAISTRESELLHVFSSYVNTWRLTDKSVSSKGLLGG